MSEVYSAINRITKALVATGIEKSRENKDQGFMFRGIDDVLNALAPLLPEHGLCILPRVVAREVMPRKTKSGGDTYNVAVHVEYDLVSAKDGSKHTVSAWGEANDTQDKSTGKAMSMAYKNACFETFCIPIKGDDADVGGDSAWDDDVATAIQKIAEAPDMAGAKLVYKDFVKVATKRGDVGAANRAKAKLLEFYPDAANKAA